MNIIIIFGHTRQRSVELTMTAVVCIKEQKREVKVKDNEDLSRVFFRGVMGEINRHRVEVGLWMGLMM